MIPSSPSSPCQVTSTDFDSTHLMQSQDALFSHQKTESTKSPHHSRDSSIVPQSGPLPGPGATCSWVGDGRVARLLMVQKSQTTTWDDAKTKSLYNPRKTNITMKKQPFLIGDIHLHSLLFFHCHVGFRACKNRDAQKIYQNTRWNPSGQTKMLK